MSPDGSGDPSAPGRGVARLRRRPDGGGFTLIELLVVIIIIGILAAVAIPVFLNQRRKGYDAAAKADLRHLAQLQEIYLHDHQSYGSPADLVVDNPNIEHSPSVTMHVLSYTAATGYCLSARHLNSNRTWYYDSRNGGLLAVDAPSCAANYTTVPGSTLVP